MLARLALAGPLFMGGIWYFDKYFRAQRDRFDFIFLPLIFVYVSYRVIAMEKEKWDSIVLDFCSDRLLRRLPHYPDLEVRREEVTTIRESSRGLTIKTISRPKALFVSSGLADYDDFRNRLFAWVPMAKVVASRDSSASNCLTVLFCFALAFGLFGTPLYVMHTTHRALII